MQESLKVLKKDPNLKPFIQKYGEPHLVRDMGYFQALVRSIIYQQVTGKAAASILARFESLYPRKSFPKPVEVRDTSIERLRSAGLSGQKAVYLKDLAAKFSDSTIREEELPKMSNEEVIAHLVEVKGIGVWTAHMFLIFTLGRLDVLPVGDLGVRKGMQVVYNMRALPTPAQMERKAKPWRAHASVASWYFWQVANDSRPMKKKLRKS